MSIKNKVSSQLPEITTYDAGGNITGVVVDSVAANSIVSNGNIVGNGLSINGNAVITGNTQVLGTLTFNNVTDIATSNLVLQLGYDQSGIAVTGGGMTVGSGDEAQFLYDQPTQTWNSNLGINAVGNLATTGTVSGAYIVGDGSQLTNLPNGNILGGDGIRVTVGTGVTYTKAAYMDVTATGSVATITPAGYASCNMIFFGFANIATPTIDTNYAVAMQKATSNSAPGTEFLLSVGGAYYDNATINTSTASSIVANVDAQITAYNAVLTGGVISGVDLDLENGITEATITQMVNAFKGLGYTVAISPQLVATSGTDITISNPTNLGLSSGGATNQYAVSIATGNVDHIFVQTYNTGGFTVGNVAENDVNFFIAAAGALDKCVDSGLQVDIPAGTTIIIGEPSNAGASYNDNNIFGVTGNVPYTQSTTLASLNSAINTMVSNPTLYGNVTGVGQWSLNNDYYPSAYGDTSALSGAFTSTIFSPTAPLSLASGTALTITNTADLQFVTDRGSVTTGNITAGYFLGNGSQLSGIGSAGSLVNGTSNVKIATANGNITMSVANVADVVTVTDNSLRVTGNIYDQYGQVYGVAASFAKFKRTSAQTGIAVNGAVICNVAEDVFGTDISVNTGTGQVTLQAGKTYRLRGQVPNWVNGSRPDFGWYNESTSAYVGSSTMSVSPIDGLSAGGVFGGTAEYVFTPTTTTILSFRLQGALSVPTALGGLSDYPTAGSYPWIDIQVIGGGAPITASYNSSSSYYAGFSSQPANVSTGSTVLFNGQFTSIGAGISYNASTGIFTLQPGTYSLTGAVGMANQVGNNETDYQWYNLATSSYVGSVGGKLANNQSFPASWQNNAQAILTVTAVTQVKLQVLFNVGVGYIQAAQSYAYINQIGGSIPVTNLLLYGSAVTTVADSTAITGTTYLASTAIMSWALPTAGTYQLNFDVASYIFGASVLYTWLGVNGTLIPNTTMQQAGSNSGGGSYPINGSFIYTATGAVTVTLNAFVNLNGGTGAVVYNSSLAGTRGTYEQIGGLATITNGTAYNTITSITDGSTTTSTTPSLMPGSTFIITNPGTYQINYSLTTRSNTTFGVFTTLWNVSNNVEVPNSATFSGWEAGTAGTYLNMSCTTIVNISAPTTFAIYWASGSSGATSTVYNNYTGSGTISQGKGDSSITYTQVGALPAAVDSVVAAAYAKYTRTTTQTGVFTNSVILCNVQESQAGSTISYDTTTGSVTLQAGGTYRLRGSPGVYTGGSGRLAVQWWNATAGTWIGEPSMALSPTAANAYAPSQGPAECIITPSATTVVQFKVGYANTTADLLANNAQTGTSDAGAPWIDVQQIGGFIPNTNVSQYGSVPNAATDNTVLSATPLPMQTINIPSSGTWQINYSGRATTSANGGYASIAVYDSTLTTQVPNSAVLVVYGAINTQATGSGSVVVTTNGPTTYRVAMVGVTANIINNIYGAGSATFTQIAGQVASAPIPTASFVKYVRTSSQTGITTNSAVICNVLEAANGSDIAVSTSDGNITLTAGKTYRLRGTIGDATRITPGSCSINFQWYNVTAGALLGTDTYYLSPSASSNEVYYGGTTEVIFTPSVTTVVQLRVTGVVNINTIGSGTDSQSFPWIDIEVIAQTVASSGVPDWTTAGTLQAVGLGATTTAPTMTTTGVTRNVVRYKQIGAKSWQVQVYFNSASTSGGTGGTGDYLLTLPAGLQFDLAQTPAYTGDVSTSSWNYFSYQLTDTQVFFNGNNDTVSYNIGTIVPWDATRYRVVVPLINTGVRCWSSGWYQIGGGFTTKFDFNWQFTFQTP